MKKITILTLSLITALILLGSVLITLPGKTADTGTLNFPRGGTGLRFDLLSEKTTSTPVAFYDFTKTEVKNTFSTISFHTRTTEGEFTTLEANWNDPQCTLTLPDGVKPCDMGYTLIVYRTTANRKGEFFAARSDNPTMGTPGTHVQWSWEASGEWETLLIENTAWSNASPDVTFQGFRFDPLESNVEVGETIDFKFLAFFTTREEAEAFDFDTYKALLSPVETEPETLPETDAPYDWPSPDYVEVETSLHDNYGGTLTYTPSADGSTVTVSYKVNGETVSYTVPNQKNYLFGGYAGVDDLGRSLYDSSEVGTYDPEKRQIGLFYFLWHEADNDQGLFDLQKILDELGMAGAANLNNGKYGSLGVTHWFAEPLYGYYYITDEWVLRKHAELLTNAGVDFLFFDVTNGVTFSDRALKLMKVLHELNEQGYDAPQIVFYTNSNVEEVVTAIYHDVYQDKHYEDTWYKLNGKPVIIAPTDEIPMARYFTVMRSQWPNEAPRENAWPWIDFEWPQRVYTSSAGAPLAVNVSIAQHSGTVCFSDSSLKGNYTNRGRSFVNPNNIPSTDPAFDSVLKAAYDAWVADPSLSNRGLNFQAQWDYALSTDAPTILVTSWNEWVAGNWGQFVDTASVEFSRDAEMTRGYYFDNYYMQMVANIQRAKGTVSAPVQDMRKAINVTGSFDQWQDVPVTYSDPAGDAAYRQYNGYGGTRYTNFTGRNDVVEAKMTADTKNLYVYVKTAEAITKYDADSSWMQLYLNTDRRTSGWYGYDFIVNYKATGDFTTTVAKYSGTDGAYHFTECGNVSYRVSGNEMMVAIPLSLLGIEGYMEIDLEFKWADSDTAYDEMEDFYCDGDTAPLGRLNYVYRNYVPGVSQITYPGASTETTTDAATDPAVNGDVNGDVTTGEDTANNGCASVVGVSSVALALTLLGGAVLLRKRED